MHFTLKTGNPITPEKIELIISRLLCEVIEENVPHLWVSGEEPIVNAYSGRVSYDYGRKVQKATYRQLEIILKGLRISFSDGFYLSPIDELLHEIYIENKDASYGSSSSKNLTSYYRLLKDKFNSWKNNELLLVDGIGKALDKDLGLDIEDVFDWFLKRAALGLYGQKLLNSVKATA